MKIHIELLKEARQSLAMIRRSMMAHPDHEEGSEFDDMTTTAQDTEDKIEDYLSKTGERIK